MPLTVSLTMAIAALVMAVASLVMGILNHRRYR